MQRISDRVKALIIFGAALALLGVFSLLNSAAKEISRPEGSYSALSEDSGRGDALRYIGEDFEVKDGFSTNLPIAILSTEGEIPEYREFDLMGNERVIKGVDPYVKGSIELIEGGDGVNRIDDAPVYKSRIRIKKKGHTSYLYDKPQYKYKSLLSDGSDNKEGILGMGEGSEWVLNGSMADKSMIRNYLAYRIASEIGGNNMSPDSRFCELLIRDKDRLIYQGVYLITEAVTRGDERVRISKYDPGERYSSYIVRRDRKTAFDIMLNTYGRQAGIGSDDPAWEVDNWIGLKYPSASKVNDETIAYIEKDFSSVEKVLYSDDLTMFKQYDRFINVDSFVDYFLINEYFGNYDAGLHSTYMFKEAGEPLSIGPVWDFDQSMDNYILEEMKPGDLAMQTATFFEELCRDKGFVAKLRKRYSYLKSNYLSEEHVFGVIDETTAYLRSAQIREWDRWAADYLDDSDGNIHNYHLQPYKVGDVEFSRFTDEYKQEIIVIKNYLHKHGEAMGPDLAALYRKAKIDTAAGGMRELIFLAAMLLLFVPSYLINRKG